MEINPEEIPAISVYQHLLRTVMPRPIAWVSTRSQAGITNLAPFSFFTAVGSRPPTLLFCPANRRDGTAKDTLRNILETGQFVVNVVTESTAEAMNLTAAEIGSEESEFELAGLHCAESQRVVVPRVRESPVSLECELQQHLSLGDGPGGANIVIGRILHLHLDDSVVDAHGYADPELLPLIGRMGGNSYCRTGDRFDMRRPKL